MDAAVRRAVRCGVPWPMAVRMATINVASHYRADHLFGSLAPGRVADIVIDPTTFEVATVIADGREVTALSSAPAPCYPSWAYETVHLERPLVADDFRLPAPAGAFDGDDVQVTAIFPGLARQGRLLPGTEKQERRLRGRVHDDHVDPGDGALAAVIDRHLASGRIGRTVVQGFGLRCGAVASTVNHDNHNLLVIGTDVDDMACAANAVAEAGGGLALAKSRTILDLLRLPIAGLLSDEPIEDVAQSMDRIEDLLARELGVSDQIPQPIMLIQMFALANIPTLGLTDLGLIDVLARSTTPTVELINR